MLRHIGLICALTLGACATNPEIVAVGSCKVLHRSGYAQSVSIYADRIKAINMLNEFPATRFIDIVLSLPVADDHAQPISALYLSIGTTEHPAGCLRTAPNKRACTVPDESLAQAGFSLTAVASDSLPDASVVALASKYWQAVSGCPKVAA